MGLSKYGVHFLKTQYAGPPHFIAPIEAIDNMVFMQDAVNKKIMGRERDVNATAPCMGPPLLQHCFPTGASGHRLPGLCHSETHDIERALETKSCKPFTMERLAHSMHTESPGDINPTPKNQSIISPPLWGGVSVLPQTMSRHAGLRKIH